MKWVIFLLPLVLVASVVNAALAEECTEENCQPPDCRCSSTDIPGGLRPRDTPQFVLLTFDDAINILNIVTYQEELYNKFNRNGCPIGTTFYVNHEYNNYQLVNELYNQGFEIGLHSISRRTPQTYWAEADYETLMREIGDQKTQMAHFANIPSEALRGVRLPFLQLAGNASFEMMASVGLEYDNSWITITYTNPGLWPYTLDYASTQECFTPPCPTSSIPGVWVLPMISWFDLNNAACGIPANCFNTPEQDDVDAWFEFILTNFERHYLGNRAPFGFYINEGYFTINPAARAAFRRFLDLITSLHDVFVVNSHEVIDWVKDPVPLDEYIEQPCRSWANAPCVATSCGPLPAEHTEMEYWMQSCTTCPEVYPWVGNPLGQ